MQILVFNAGSSSLKFGIFSVTTETHEVFKGSYERFRTGGCEYRFRHGETDERGAVEFDSPSEALKVVPAALKRFGLDAIDAVGHRIVHGGAGVNGGRISGHCVEWALPTGHNQVPSLTMRRAC